MFRHFTFKRRNIALILLVFFFFLFVQSVVSLDVIITPDRIPIMGEKGDVISRLVVLENNENVTVSFNITCTDDNLSVVPTSVIIGVDSSAVMSVSYTLQVNASAGNITFAWVDNNLSISVQVVEEIPEEIPSEAPVEIFPIPPKSGSDIAIFFTGTNTSLDATGFLYCNGYMYSVAIIDGYGLVHLDRNAYGSATLRLFGIAVSNGDSVKTFTIVKGESINLRVSVPKKVVIDSDVKATIILGEAPVSNLEVTVENPDDVDEIFVTDNMGQIEFTADVIGKWRLMASAEGQIATGSVQVDYGKLALGVLEEEPQIGDAITIVTEPEAVVTVRINGVPENEYTATEDGLISHYISKGGRYELTGSLEKLRGTYSFQVAKKAEIVVLDYTMRTPVDINKVEKGKRYAVEITDSAGNILQGAETLWIANPIGTRELITLRDGVGTWMPFTTGSYILSIDDIGSHTANTLYVLITPPPSDFGLVIAIIIILAVILCVLIILALYSKKRGVPLKHVLSSIVHKKARTDIPIG